MTLVSDHAFRWFLSALTGGAAGLWAIHDLVFLFRLRRVHLRSQIIADQRFGYVIGIVVGLIGVFGTLRYNGVL